MPARKLNPAERRHNVVQSRLNDADTAKLDRLRSKAGMGRSDYIQLLIRRAR